MNAADRQSVSEPAPHENARVGAEFRDDLRRASLPSPVVKQLSVTDPLKASLALLETCGVVAASLAVALIWWQPLVVIPAVLVIASRQQALFVLAHDAAHYRLCDRRALNDGLGRLCGVLIGVSMCTYRVVHRLHHNHLYDAQDPDIPLHGGYPRGRAYFIGKLTKDALGLTWWKTYAYFFGVPVANTQAVGAQRPLNDTSPRLRNAALRDRWVVLGFHIAVPAAAFAVGSGMEYLVLWVLPLLTALQVLLRFRAVCEHGAVVDLSSPLTAARTNLCSAWLRWFLFPHHVNFHIEHHMYPAIPHYNLPACHREMRAHGLLDAAEAVPFLSTVRRVAADPVATPARIHGNGRAPRRG